MEILHFDHVSSSVSFHHRSFRSLHRLHCIRYLTRFRKKFSRSCSFLHFYFIFQTKLHYSKVHLNFINHKINISWNPRNIMNYHSMNSYLIVTSWTSMPIHSLDVSLTLTLRRIFQFFFRNLLFISSDCSSLPIRLFISIWLLSYRIMNVPEYENPPPYSPPTGPVPG